MHHFVADPTSRDRHHERRAGTYAPDEYMDAYFSVSPAQEAASSVGLPAYDTDAGFKYVSLEISADYKLTEQWTVTSKLSYLHHLGDAADNPVTGSEDQFTGGLGLTYTFGRTRQLGTLFS